MGQTPFRGSPLFEDTLVYVPNAILRHEVMFKQDAPTVPEPPCRAAEGLKVWEEEVLI